MGPGSIVHCIKHPSISAQIFGNLIKPEFNTNYTVREVFPKGTKAGFFIGSIHAGDIYFKVDVIRLEEIVNEVMVFEGINIIEPFYAMEDFREVLPPIENIEEHINENIQEFEYV